MSSINLIGKIQLTVATTAERMAVIPMLAEPIWDETLHSLFVGDGVTYGGIEVSGDTSHLESQIIQLQNDLADEIQTRNDADNNLQNNIDLIENELTNLINSLAVVATTGSYNDLLDKPSIPAAQVNSDWNAISGVAQILNKPNLATIATSGQFTDILGKPTTLAGYGIDDGVINTRTISAGTGLSGGGNLTANRTIALNATSIASLAKADTAVQPGSLATVATTGSYNDLIDKPSIPQGTVTSIGATVPTGLQVSGSPITNSGTLAITYAAGYQGFTTAQSNTIAGIASTYIPLTQRGANNGVATLGNDGKIPTGQLPNLAITDTFVVNSQVAMLALTVERGDIAVRSDISKSYINSTGNNGSMSDWVELLAPPNAVLSVNGQTGTVVLSKSDVGLGNVDNTSDVNKPISTATQTALNAKANNTVTITAGTGLTGGGNLTANRTVALSAGTIASLAKADTSVQSVTAGSGINIDNTDPLNPIVISTSAGGSVTSVAASVPTGFVVSGSPVTTSGTIAIDYDSGYQGFTSAESTKLSGIATGATVGATWGTNLYSIPANITSWASIAPADKADTADVVLLTGAQTVAGIKTLTSPNVVNNTTTEMLRKGVNNNLYLTKNYQFWEALGSGGIFAHGYYRMGLYKDGDPLTAGNALQTAWALGVETDNAVTCRVSLSSPIFKTAVTGRGNGTILEFVNTGGNFNGITKIGHNYNNPGTGPNSAYLYFGPQKDSVWQVRDSADVVKLSIDMNADARFYRDLRFDRALSLNGSHGTAGQVLTSAGASAAPTWQTLTIPAAQVPSDWAASSGVSRILNKPTTLSGFGITDAVPSNRTLTAGNGLTGGGDLTASRTLTLGTPDSTTLASTNAVTSTSHTHAFAPGGTNAQYIRGDGSVAATNTIAAATAATLATARTIGGVSFNGSADINLPGVNTTGNQNTTGSAATLTTPRTLTIGGTGKTFNGSANVSWSLAEIGAATAAQGALADTAVQPNTAVEFTTARARLLSTTITANTTATTTHCNAIVKKTNTSSYNFTINSGLGDDDDTITVVNAGTSGDITIVQGSGVTIYSMNGGTTGNYIVTPMSKISLVRVSSTVWVI